MLKNWVTVFYTHCSKYSGIAITFVVFSNTLSIRIHFCKSSLCWWIKITTDFVMTSPKIMSSISKETKQQNSSLAAEELFVVWFGWAHCLAHQVCLMSVQQFCYLLHQVCWKLSIVPVSTGSFSAAELLSFALWVYSGISFSGSCCFDAWFLWAALGSVPSPSESPKGEYKRKIGDVTSWTWSTAGHLRRVSFNSDALHLDNLQQKPRDGGKYLQRGGSGELRFSTQCYMWDS